MLRAQFGDREAIESLLRNIQPMLTRYVRAVVGAGAAEDVTQEVMVTIFRKLWTLTDQEVLRKTLNEIDGLRFRMGWGFGITAAMSQAAWIAVVIGSRQASDRQLILLCAFAGAMTVFGGVFMLTLVIYRMTHKILQAIEIGSRRV